MDKLEVYFSKLPKNCLECPCFQSDEMCCGLDDGTQDYFKDEIDGGKCPLKKIHSKTTTQKIVREVCEKIRDLAGSYFEISLCENCGEQPYNDVILTGNDLAEILDQIQKEYEK